MKCINPNAINNNQIKEIISPIADKIIEEITSNKLSYKQASMLLRLVDERIKDLIIVQ